MKIKNKVKNNKAIIILSVCTVVLIICAIIVYLNRESLFGLITNNTSQTTSQNKPSDSKNASEPDKTSNDSPNSISDGTAEQQLPKPSSNSGSSSGSSSVSKSVAVSINDASQYGNTIEVRAYINGIVESDGTCTFTFTKDAKTITKTSASLTNPNYTNCETVSVPTSEFASKGTWQLKISYQSPKSQGSASTSLEIK